MTASAASRTRMATEIAVHLGALALLVGLCLTILAPFVGIVLWALILAIALDQPFETLVRWLGGRRGEPVGILSVDLGEGVVQVRQALSAAPGQRVELNLDAGRVIAFREGWRLPGIGAEIGPEVGP